MNAFDPQGCGCAICAAKAGHISNRPALPAIQYRIGTHGSFMQAMRASASKKDELK
jgi:hypothetical protein